MEKKKDFGTIMTAVLAKYNQRELLSMRFDAIKNLRIIDEYLRQRYPGIVLDDPAGVAISGREASDNA